MRTTLMLFGLLVLLAGGYLWWLYQEERTSLAVDEISFAIPDTSEVGQIELTQYRLGEVSQSVILNRKKDEGWQVNGEHVAFQPYVNHLLTTMHLLRVKETLTPQGQKAGQEILNRVHTRVKAFDRRGRLLRDYRLGTAAKSGHGSLMQMADAQTPYIVERPGHQGFVNGFYSLDTYFWRENLLFDGQLARLQKIELQYLNEPEKSFVLERSASQAPWHLAEPDGLPSDTAALNAYLKHFTGKIYGESFAEPNFPGQFEALQGREPDRRFAVTNFKGERRELLMFIRPENPNNFFGWVKGEEELLTIQHFVMDKYLITRGELLGIQAYSMSLSTL